MWVFQFRPHAKLLNKCQMCFGGFEYSVSLQVHFPYQLGHISIANTLLPPPTLPLVHFVFAKRRTFSSSSTFSRTWSQNKNRACHWLSAFFFLFDFFINQKCNLIFKTALQVFSLLLTTLFIHDNWSVWRTQSTKQAHLSTSWVQSVLLKLLPGWIQRIN